MGPGIQVQVGQGLGWNLNRKGNDLKAWTLDRGGQWMAKEKEWKLALRARSGPQGEDWEGRVLERSGRRRRTRKGLGAGEGLGEF